jgi:hypothetical protein
MLSWIGTSSGPCEDPVTDDNAPAVDRLLIEAVEVAKLPEPVADAIYAAVLSDAERAAVVGGTVPSRLKLEPVTSAATPIRTYRAGIEGATVACGLIRSAIESTCHDLAFVKGMRAGQPGSATEAAIGAAQSLRSLLALTLLGDAKRCGDVDAAVTKLHHKATDVVRAANKGTYGEYLGGRLSDLIDDARVLVTRLAES